MISFKKLSVQPQNFSRLSGVKIEKFREIVGLIRSDWEKFQKKKKRAGRRSHLPDLETEVLLVLVYYRFYTSFLFLGAIFNIVECLRASSASGTSDGEEDPHRKESEFYGK